MNVFFLFSCMIMNALSGMKPKICVNCRHFIASQSGANVFGRCKLFPLIIDDGHFLITGENEKSKVEYSHCSVARTFEHMCGSDGKMYKGKYPKKPIKTLDYDY